MAVTAIAKILRIFGDAERTNNCHNSNSNNNHNNTDVGESSKKTRTPRTMKLVKEQDQSKNVLKKNINHRRTTTTRVTDKVRDLCEHHEGAARRDPSLLALRQA